MFSGSYPPDDVTFLLKRVHLAPTAVAEKERLIQSGRRHYSEMISAESPPSPRYRAAFHEGFARNRRRFAADVAVLARHLAATRPGPITLVSLARAGTPVGVLLRRTLARHLDRPCSHYSVSIIRDRGIDEVALRHILDRHPPASVVFVDGWTGKGVIAGELHTAVTAFNARHHTNLDAGLHVVADLCGAAAVAATAEDYLIPSCVLGATVSGLVSRSILNDAVIAPGDFHGCLYYEDLACDDQSRWFVDELTRDIATLWDAPEVKGRRCVPPAESARWRQASACLVADLRRQHDLSRVDYVKPGVGEATRVLLRRVPGLLLVRREGDAEVAPLLVLAQEKGVPVRAEATLPYRAAALIRETGA